MDVLLPPPPKGTKETPPRLEIKKDPKGMVTVTGATTVEVRAIYSLSFIVQGIGIWVDTWMGAWYIGVEGFAAPAIAGQAQGTHIAPYVPSLNRQQVSGSAWLAQHPPLRVIGIA
jgi:hypothetical protein